MPPSNTIQSAAKRVPIALSADEIGVLQLLATHEQRSVANMAGIIYREGLKQYSEQNRTTRARRR
jgi:hypothetical protein